MAMLSPHTPGAPPAGRTLLRHILIVTLYHHPRPVAVLLPTTWRTTTASVTLFRRIKGSLGQAKILITNFHAFKLREKVAAGKITKSILAAQKPDGQPGLFTETPDQMVRRVCRELGTRKTSSSSTRSPSCYRPSPTARMNAERR
jgi:hypothetical protein